MNPRTLVIVKNGAERIDRNRRKQTDRRLEVALKLSLYEGQAKEIARLERRVEDLKAIIASYEDQY